MGFVGRTQQTHNAPERRSILDSSPKNMLPVIVFGLRRYGRCIDLGPAYARYPG